MTDQPRLICSFLLIVLCLSGRQSGTPTEPKPTTPPPFGYLDTPSTATTITGPTIEIRGWVLDSSDTQPTIKLSVDGQPLDAPLQRAARKDVCNAYPAVKHCGISKAGFVLNVGTARFTDGSHTITFDAASKDGATATIATQQFSVKKKTCLVLSVGEARGIAHIGAIDALKEAGIKPDCVADNSMGANCR
jgi:hypothetical protein